MKKEKQCIIYEAALKVFSEYGFERSTMDDIAEVAGIAKGTIYYNYRSKRELFLAIIDDAIDKMTDRMEKIIENPGDVSLKLEKIIEVQLNFYDEYKNYCKVLLSEVLWSLGGHWQEEAEKVRQKIFGQVEKVVAGGIEQGNLSPELSSKTVSSALFGMTVVTGFNYFLFEKNYSLENVKKDLQELFLKGVQIRQV